jgi:hypothetical protein
MSRSITPPPSISTHRSSASSTGVLNLGPKRTDATTHGSTMSMSRSITPPKSISTHRSTAASTGLLSIPITAARSHASAISSHRLERKKEQHEALQRSLAARQGGFTPRAQLLSTPSSATPITGKGVNISASTFRPRSVANSVDLRGKGLRELPSTLNFSRLVFLDASENRIGKLPAELLLLCRSLRTLNLNLNVLEELPDALVELNALRNLDVSENKLSSLPSGMGELALTTLYAADNKLASLPESLVKMTSLVELDVGGNQLTELPQAIGSLPSLTFLVVSENQLTELPESVFEARSLKDLRCMNNSFSAQVQSTIDTKASIFRFTDPEHIYRALGAEDDDEKEIALVQLVRSTWLVKRAEALERALVKAGDDEEAEKNARKKWALPRRQDLLLREPEAFIHEPELKRLTPKRARGRIAVAAVSQCVGRSTGTPKPCRPPHASHVSMMKLISWNAPCPASFDSCTSQLLA